MVTQNHSKLNLVWLQGLYFSSFLDTIWIVLNKLKTKTKKKTNKQTNLQKNNNNNNHPSKMTLLNSGQNDFAKQWYH